MKKRKSTRRKKKKLPPKKVIVTGVGGPGYLTNPGGAWIYG